MRTILIIDDDIAIGNMEQEVLERAGYTTRRAYSGTEALLVLKTMRPDLILLDLMLPGLSGKEISSHILDELSRLATHYGFIDSGRMVKEMSGGLSCVQAERLFDRFFTVETARSSTGLGLSIAKQLTEKLGGSIRAEYGGGKLQIRLSLPRY